MLIDGLNVVPGSAKMYTGIEAVTVMPTTNLFNGRQIMLTENDGSLEPGPYTRLRNKWILNTGGNADTTTLTAALNAYADTKANAALAAAKSYADMVAGTGSGPSATGATVGYVDDQGAVLDSSLRSYSDNIVNNALVAAKAYADSIVTAVSTTAQGYTDTALVNVGLNANAFATSTIGAALAEAKNYADRNNTSTLDNIQSRIDIASNNAVTTARNYSNTKVGSVSIGSGLTGSISSGVLSLHADTSVLAERSYVDAVVQGLDIKATVRVATTSSITLSGLQSIDGVNVSAGDRVLVKNQVDGAQNGIYVAASGSWSRAADANTSAELSSGAFCFVEAGTTQKASAWVSLTRNPTLGTTAIEFTTFSSNSGYTAGFGISMTGSVISVNSNDLATRTYADSKVGTVNASGGVSASLSNGTLTLAVDPSVLTTRAYLSTALSSLPAQKSIAVGGSGLVLDTSASAYTLSIDSNVFATKTYASTTFAAKATTLSGYGITDALTAAAAASTFAAKGTTLAAYGITDAMPKSGGSFSGAITLQADPTQALGAATKQYVDSVAKGLDVKSAVKAATTSNITLSGTKTIDGVSCVVGDRVLVKDQTTGSQNGIYVVASGAWSRAADASTGGISTGMYCFVNNGTANGYTSWILVTANPISVGTTALAFNQFSSSSSASAGTGLNQAGTTLSIADTGITAGQYTKVTFNAQGQATGGTTLSESDIPSLSWSKIGSGKPSTLAGYGITDALDASVLTNYATKATTLAGYGITNAYSKTEVDSAVNAKATKATTLTGYGITDALSIDGGTLTGVLTLSADPTLGLHAATKQYVDSVVSGLDVKPSVMVATTGNITLSGLQVIDGYTVSAGDRVLVKNQTNATQNGLYDAAVGTWARSGDANANSEVTSGMFTFVERGTVNAASGWVLTTTGTIVLGSTGLSFSQFNGSGSVSFGTGLVQSGSSVSIDNSALPYDFSAAVYGRPGAGAVVLRSAICRTMKFLSGMVGCVASCDATATAQSVLSVKKNGVAFGTITFAAGTNIATLTSASDTTFYSGDVLTIAAAATQDDTLGDIQITLSAVLS